MEVPKRKSARLKEYDYSQNGAYFITICTHNKQNLFWEPSVGVGIPDDPITVLSDYGKYVNDTIEFIHINNINISIDKYVIMPNHIHIICVIQNGASGMPHPTTRPNEIIPSIISSLKRYTNKITGMNLW